MLAKGPPTSHNFLKIVIRKMLLKMFSTLTYITAQLRCRSRRAWMPKGMASQPLGLKLQIGGGDKCT
jgi:hypothetical protein